MLACALIEKDGRAGHALEVHAVFSLARNLGYLNLDLSPLKDRLRGGVTRLLYITVFLIDLLLFREVDFPGFVRDDKLFVLDVQVSNKLREKDIGRKDRDDLVATFSIPRVLLEP